MMNTKQRYRMGYCGWLKDAVSDFLDKKMLADMVYGLLCFLLLTLSLFQCQWLPQ